MISPKRPRILMSAYQCGPEMGSVSQIGWEWYSRMAKRAPVTLLTHIRNRRALEAAGAPLAGTEVRYIDTEWFAGPLYRTASRLFPQSQHAVFTISSFDFYLYDYQALRWARSNSGLPWDVVHAVTPVSPLAATRLGRLGLPLVVGPWNGGLSTSPHFPEIMQSDSGWTYHLRSLGKGADRWINCAGKASVLLSATGFTDGSIPLEHAHKIVRMCENAVDLDVFQPGEPLPNPGPDTPLQVTFVGRLVPVKAVSLLLRAAAVARNKFPIELTIVGDGPLRNALQTEAQARSLQDVVRFTGNLPLKEIAALLPQAHVFCLPSIRESGGAVLLEAMACALPVLAVNHGGPAELVDDANGRLLSAAGPEQLVQDLTKALEDYVAAPECWRERGREGRRRMERQGSWEARMDHMEELYQRVCFRPDRHLPIEERLCPAN
jgi:glycosyltransferase involved in cell wall biosynthesis